MPALDTPKPLIALFSHHPECSNQCCEGIERALGDHYRIQRFDENSLNADILAQADIVAFPGGIGDADTYYDFFLRKRANMIADYVERGGRYLGICMGAYWAGSEYLNILDGVDAVQYIRRPGTDTHRPHAKNLPVLWRDRWGNIEPWNMFFYDGCALVGDKTKFRTMATYMNGDAMAIIQNNIGLIGCHPESEQFWYDSYSWMRGRYHRGQHHTLLLDFVDQMFVTK